jgi:uncharacterized protein YecT (DUF1311 family)
MKPSITSATLLIVTCTFVALSMQVKAQSRTERLFTIEQCRVRVNAQPPNEFIIRNLSIDNSKAFASQIYGWEVGNYHIIFPKPTTTVYGYEHNGTMFHIYCNTGIDIGGVDGGLGAHKYKDVWTIGKENTPLEPEWELREIAIIGDNLIGTLLVKKIEILAEDENTDGKPDSNPANMSYNFCIQEPNGSQVMCGNGFLWQIKDSENDFELNMVIEALKTISFDSSFVPSAPSFDCAKTNLQTEKVICRIAKLSRLDSILATNYKNLLFSNIEDNGKNLKRDQRAFIKMRNTCKTVECLTDVYTRRIEEVCTKYPVVTGVFPPCTLSKDTK